jgi:nitrogen regulatory protein PII
VKVVVAVIRPDELDDVREALNGVGIHGLTLAQVLGYGRQDERVETYRESQFVITMVPKLRLEILADESQVDKVVETVIARARTGEVGDGKVWVQSVEDVVRIRTGEHGADAV